MNKSLSEQLLEPFPAESVTWEISAVRGPRALVIACLNVEAVQDRLDAVFGVDGWQDAYYLVSNGSVVCKLRVKIGNEWIEKSDLGIEGDQPDEGGRTKAAFSDALKRAAVKFGIGRYLCDLPQQWVDYNPSTRRLSVTPRLAEWALPATKGSTP